MVSSSFVDTRVAMQRVATHVLARRRFAVTGKFGLRAAPGGIATPAFGDEAEVVRISGTRLVHEVAGSTPRTTVLELDGASLREAADLVGVELDPAFRVGHDTPPLGDVDAPLHLVAADVTVLAGWFVLAWRVLDDVVVSIGPAAAPSVVQMWPEHFDAACDVAVGPGRRANLGASPGDGFSDQPYFSFGPWGDERPGDVGYWNAPFGAVFVPESDPPAAGTAAAAVEFLRRGLELLA